MADARSIIAIDLDDTIADSTEALRLLVNQRLGAELTTEDYRVEGEYWGYYERVWSQHGLTDASHDDFSAEMVVDQMHVPLLPGASFAIKQLLKRFQVIFVTARDASWEEATRSWITNHFGEEPFELYFIESHKNENAQTKGQLCQGLGAALLIDDNVQHCKSAIDEGLGAVLFGNYGWHVDVPVGIVRCHDWPAVLEHIDGTR